MGSHDVAFLRSRASFYTTFIKNCSGGYVLWNATCHEIVVWVSKGILSVKYRLFMSVEF